MEIDNEKFTEAECATSGGVGISLPPKDYKPALLTSPAVIRILVLYTSNANNAVANINDVALLGV